MEARKKFKRVVPEEVKVSELTTNDIVCGTTKCSEGFHCYSQKKSSMRKYGKERACKECGEDLVDWTRVHKNNLDDTDFIFNELKHEIIRHVFWHTAIEDSALYSAFTRGEAKTNEIARKLLKIRIGKFNNYMDGRQTPMGKDEIINYAQHATATCCRKCLEAWHNIPMEEALSDGQLDFCASLVMKYVKERLPHLNNDGMTDAEADKIIRDEYH